MMACYPKVMLRCIAGLIIILCSYSTLLYTCNPLVNFNDDCDAHRFDYISLEFNYGLPGDQVNTTTVGTGATGETTGLVFLTTPASGDSVDVTTARTVPTTNANDEGYAIFAAAFDRSNANTTQFIGLFDADNGIAVGFPPLAAPFSVLYRVDGVDTIIGQPSFNVDPLDGSGPSGFSINFIDLNTFRVSFIWYGTNLIRYQVLGTNGEWITFHEIENVNSQAAMAAFGNPGLPMRIEQINATGGASTDVMYTTAWRAGVIHSGENNAGTRTFDMQNTITTIATGETYLFTIRNKTTFGGEPNKVLVRLSRVGGGNALENITPVILRYYKNAVLTGAAFADINTANSVVEADTSAVSFSGGHLLWMIGKAGLVFEKTPEGKVEFILGPGESITVTGDKTVILVMVALYGTATWEELQ